MIAKAVVDWVAERGFKTLFIEPGSPWHSYSESFNSRFRDEFLNVELFGTLLEAKVLGSELADAVAQRRFDEIQRMPELLPPAPGIGRSAVRPS